MKLHIWVQIGWALLNSIRTYTVSPHYLPICLETKLTNYMPVPSCITLATTSNTCEVDAHWSWCWGGGGVQWWV